MHHQVPEERAKLLQILPVQGVDLLIVCSIVTVVVALARCHLVIDRIKPVRNRYDDRGNGQRIEKRRQHRGNCAKQQ